MDKYFICLANSYKHGGRCLAGIEITFDAERKPVIVRYPDGRPRWIRPVSNEADGAIPTKVATGINLFSLVKLTEVFPCPNKAHVEDTRYASMQYRNGYFIQNDELLRQCIDTKHQNVFYFQGKAIPATMIERLDYSLMLIKPEKAQAYIDEEREKSKYRMRFSYYGLNYDFPITDPAFLEAFKKSPDSFSDMQDVFLTLSLGMEFEGFHFKLVAAVLLPNLKMDFIRSSSPDKSTYMDQQKQLHPNAYAKWSQEDDALLLEMHKQGASLMEIMTRFKRNEGAIRSRLKKLLIIEDETNYWFDEYEKELTRLLDLKKDVDDRLAALRKELLQQMEIHGEEKVKSEKFTVSYTPPKTVMQFNNQLFKEENEQLYRNYCTIFDSKLFREENKELYEIYCNKPVQKGASIMVRRKNDNE